MSVFTRFIAAVAVAGSFALAAAPAQASYETTYFPLKQGNEWNYQKSGFAWSGMTKVTCDAEWTHPTNRGLWHRVRNYNGNYRWVQQNSIGRIYEWQTRQWYRLGAGRGYPWFMSVDESLGGAPCCNGARLEVVSRTEQVTVPAGTFSTIHITYRTQCADAGITDEWFAKGVGLVKRAEQSFGGPRYWELVSAKISGRQIGIGATVNPPVRMLVNMGQADYWENHMPGPGPRPTEGPEIKITTIVHPLTSQDVTLNFPDYNFYAITVHDPDGNQVWMSPVNRIMAPIGGVNRVIPVAGEVTDWKFKLPWGSKPGTYSVKAKLKANGNYPEVTTAFSYGWAM